MTAVFEYMIGNPDWSDVAGHNVEILDRGGAALAVPYDFDFSGIVDAPYAEPNPRFKLRSVKSRLYRGRCINNAYVEESIQKFRDKRDVIYSLITDQPGFEDKTRKNLIKFVDKFYALIAEPKKVENYMIKRCI